MTDQTPPIVAIKEANTHLQALHDRNQQLEKEVVELRAILSLKLEQEQSLVLQKAQEEHVHLKKNKQLETLVKEKNEIIEERNNQIVYLQSEIKNLDRQLQEKCKFELVSNELKRKVHILNEILKYKSALESVSLCLEQVEDDFIKNIDELVQVNLSRRKSGGPIDENENVVNGNNLETKT